MYTLLNVTFYRPSLKIQPGAILGSLILNPYRTNVENRVSS